MHKLTSGLLLLIGALLVAPRVVLAQTDCELTRQVMAWEVGHCKESPGDETCPKRMQTMNAQLAANCGAAPAATQPSAVHQPRVAAPSYKLGGLNAKNGAASSKDPFEGKECNYFTRPLHENSGGVERLNHYSDHTGVCYSRTFYVCESSHWVKKGDCSLYPGAANAEDLERRPFAE